MALERYGQYWIVSRPQQNNDRSGWLVYASITWVDNDGSHHHQFTEGRRALDSEEAALAAGFLIARAWIQNNL